MAEKPLQSNHHERIDRNQIRVNAKPEFSKKYKKGRRNETKILLHDDALTYFNIYELRIFRPSSKTLSVKELYSLKF